MQRNDRDRQKEKEAKGKMTVEEIFQDDRVLFIVDYPSGGALYGVTWEKMRLEPWEDFEEAERVASATLFIF